MTTDLKTTTRTCRLLYYGPADAGKRANLRIIHQSIAPEMRLPSQSNDPERSIAFNVHQGAEGDWQVIVNAVDTGSEPPRSAAGATPPFDGVVFVVDSGASTLDRSLASLESLKCHLDTWNLDLLGIPVVLQYNRRDREDTLPVDRLESLLNPWGLLSFPTDAARGEGVRETLKSILGLTVKHLATRPPSVPLQPDAVPQSCDAEPGTQPTTPGLSIDYGPPVPGSDVGDATKARGDAIFDELRPPVVVPVRIPRRLLQDDRPLRILLEIAVDDDSS